MKNQLKKVSKFLSYVLRHHPESIGVELDEKGWVSVDELIRKTIRMELTEELIRKVVVTSDKQRFQLSEDGKRIKANHGHTKKIELDLEPMVPPEVLYHGTASRFLESILKEGIHSQQRQYVHLSDTKSMARSVGSRYGKPVILHLDTGKMARDGVVFYKTANNVWLVEGVAVEYIQRAEEL